MSDERDASGTREQEIDIACRDLVEIVTDYLEGALDPTMSRVVESHLARCPGCDDYVAQMRTTISLLGCVPLDSLSTQAKTDLMAAFRDFRA